MNRNLHHGIVWAMLIKGFTACKSLSVASLAMISIGSCFQWFLSDIQFKTFWDVHSKRKARDKQINFERKGLSCSYRSRCSSVFVTIPSTRCIICCSVAWYREFWRSRQFAWRCHAPLVFLHAVIQILDTLASIRCPASDSLRFTSETSCNALLNWLVNHQILPWACCKLRREALGLHVSFSILSEAI
jgi:hypothetical protein